MKHGRLLSPDRLRACRRNLCLGRTARLFRDCFGLISRQILRVRGSLCFQVRGGRPLSANSATSFPSPFSYLFILTLFSYFLSLLPFPTSFPFSLSVPLLLSPFRFTFFFSRLPSPFFLAFSPLSLILLAPSFLFYFLFPLSSPTSSPFSFSTSSLLYTPLSFLH